MHALVVASKGATHTKPSTTHRTGVGLLPIVYSPNVKVEVIFQCKVFTTNTTGVWFLALVYTPDVTNKIT